MCKRFLDTQTHQTHHSFAFVRHRWNPCAKKEFNHFFIYIFFCPLKTGVVLLKKRIKFNANYFNDVHRSNTSWFSLFRGGRSWKLVRSFRFCGRIDCAFCTYNKSSAYSFDWGERNRRDEENRKELKTIRQQPNRKSIKNDSVGNDFGEDCVAR